MSEPRFPLNDIDFELEAEAVRVENDCEVCGRPCIGVWCGRCEAEESLIEDRGGWGDAA